MEEVQPLRKVDASGEDVSVPPAPMAQEQSWRCGSVVDITITVGVCVLYTLVGPLLILNNKYLLTSGFPYPIVLTSLTQAATVVFAVAAALLSRMRYIEWEMPRREFDGTLVRASVIVGFATATCLCAGNSAYLYLSVSFIEILKGYAPLVTMMMQGCFGIGYPERKPVLAVLASCVGTTIASAGEVHASPLGLLVFFSSMYFEATRLILTQKLLGQYKMHVVEALLYVSPATFVFTAAAAATIELPRFKPEDIRNPPTEPFWVGIGLSCLLGCLINLSSFLVIQRTNVVMLKLLSISRNAGVIVSGVVLFGEAISPMQACGCVITLIFFVVYNYLQVTAAQAAAGAKLWVESSSLDGLPPTDDDPPSSTTPSGSAGEKTEPTSTRSGFGSRSGFASGMFGSPKGKFCSSKLLCVIFTVVIGLGCSAFALSSHGSGGVSEHLESKVFLPNATPVSATPSSVRHETSSSLLVVVTGVWKSESSDQKHVPTLLYLDTILNNYVAACEVGFRVHVVLTTYAPHLPHTTRKSWEDLVDFERYYCQRIEASIPISVEHFENRGLPAGAFGTAGDLAIRHREIFMRQRMNFDLFLVQEDDIDIRPRTLLYAERWIQRFHGTPFWPVFLDTEVANKQRFADWRLNVLDLFYSHNDLFGKVVMSPGSSGRSYMITSHMLGRVDATKWIDPSRVRGEFNPHVASSNVLVEMGKTMVVPLEHGHWLDSFVAHLPDKYIKKTTQRNATPETFVPDMFSTLRVVEFQAALQTCVSAMTNSTNITYNPQLIYEEPSCFERLRKLPPASGSGDRRKSPSIRMILKPDRGIDLAPRKISIRFTYV